MRTEPRDVGEGLATTTIRKLQLRLIPFLFLLYVVAMVDRINIGFASLTMNGDLGITREQYGFACWGWPKPAIFRESLCI